MLPNTFPNPSSIHLELLKNQPEESGVIETSQTPPPTTQTATAPVVETQPTTDFRVSTSPEITTDDLVSSTDDVFAERQRLLQEAQTGVDTARTERDTLRQGIISNMERLTGKTARQLQIEAEMGVPGDTAEIAALRRNIADIRAQLDQEMSRTDLGVTQRSIIGEQSRIERRFLAEIGAKSTLIQALQGNIAAAQALAERTVNLEFEGIENELMVKMQKLAFKEEDLTEVEQRLQGQYAQEAARIEEMKAERQAVFDIAIELQKNGASPDLVAQVLGAQGREEALVLGSGFVSHEKMLDMMFKQEQISTSRLQQQKLRQEINNFGQLSPEAQRKYWEERDQKMLESRSALNMLDETIDQIKNLINNPGLNARVGSTVLARAPQSLAGSLKYVYRPQDLASQLSGDQQYFSGSLKHLTDMLTLEELSAARRRGITFGALSDNQMDMVRAVATKITKWEIKDKKGNPTGFYNISPELMRKELEFLLEKTETSRVLQEGQAFKSDERESLDRAFGDLSASIYY